MINISKIYGITIEKNTKRWEKLEKDVLDTDLDIKLQKIIGIDGKKVLMADIKEECSDLTKNFFITHEMYGKCKSHLLLWNEIIKTNPKNDEYFMILEDDAVIPKNFKDYIKKLNEFLNKIPKDILDKTDLFNLSPGGDYCTSKNLNQNVMSFITNIISLILSKKKTKNEILFEENDYKVLNSNFPLCTHAYIVNAKQLKKLIKSFEKNKITYHLDIYLNTENRTLYDVITQNDYKICNKNINLFHYIIDNIIPFSDIKKSLNNDLLYKILENKSFSGGQEKRIYLAMWLYYIIINIDKYDILILDEPDKSLDTETVNKLLNNILNEPMLSKLNIIVISHNIKNTYSFDKIYKMINDNNVIRLI